MHLCIRLGKLGLIPSCHCNKTPRTQYSSTNKNLEKCFRWNIWRRRGLYRHVGTCSKRHISLCYQNFIVCPGVVLRVFYIGLSSLCVAATNVGEHLSISRVQVGNSSSFMFTAPENGCPVRKRGGGVSSLNFFLFFFFDCATAGWSGL